MIFLVITSLLSLNMPVEMVHGQTNQDICDSLQENLAFMKEISVKIDKLNSTIKHLARQQILSQLDLEERARSNGNSGIKQVRITREGTRSYYTQSSGGITAIHDHCNEKRTVGMGELDCVVNGVEFRTRHSDYRLNMPSKTSQKLHETEEIPFPDVPPKVLSLGTVEEQVVEMKKWFNAWKQQTMRRRDYRSYFKPVMCYLEGAWMFSGEQVDESFVNDSQQIDAKNWFDLDEMVRFVSYTGAKPTKENLAFLPRAIMNISSENVPVFARWNYRILCHPISFNLKLNRLRMVDDLHLRIIYAKTKEEFLKSKLARFSLNVFDRMKFEDKLAFNKLLEAIMVEIPGLNNYGTILQDYGFDGIAKQYAINNDNPIAASFYHSRYATSGKDASGNVGRSRGFSDQNLFMALTNHSQVAGMDNIKCFNGEQKCPIDEYKHQRWSYAIPLEIIYLTPLSKWNPYDIEFKGDCNGDIGKTVTAGGRDGTFDKPFNGSCEQKFYITPAEFFLTVEVNQDPADTAPEGTVYVLDKNGTKRAVRATGIRILFPAIDETGVFRQRYPIAPVHGEGSAVWKELEALQDIFLNPAKFSHMHDEPSEPILGEEVGDIGGVVTMKTSTTAVPSLHYHTFPLTENQRASLNMGESVTVVTEQVEGHNHTLQLILDEVECTKDNYMYRYISCDGSSVCRDGHTVCVFVE